MSRSIKRIQELIGRSIDERQQLPQWLQERITQDQSLKEFQEASRQLAHELQLSSDEWLEYNRGWTSQNSSSSSASEYDSSVPIRAKEIFSSRGTWKGESESKREHFEHRIDLDAPRTMPAERSVELGSRRSTYRVSIVASLVAAAAAVLAVGWFQLFAPSQSSNAPEFAVVEANQESRDKKEFSANAIQISPGIAASEGTAESSEASSEDTFRPSDDRFKKYFYVTVESSYRTLQSVSEVISNNAVVQPLRRTIEASRSLEQSQLKSESFTYDGPVSDEPLTLKEKQIQLIYELLETTDFLVETLPNEITKSWVDLSVASNRSQ